MLVFSEVEVKNTGDTQVAIEYIKFGNIVWYILDCLIVHVE